MTSTWWYKWYVFRSFAFTASQPLNVWFVKSEISFKLSVLTLCICYALMISESEFISIDISHENWLHVHHCLCSAKFSGAHRGVVSRMWKQNCPTSLAPCVEVDFAMSGCGSEVRHYVSQFYHFLKVFEKLMIILWFPSNILCLVFALKQVESYVYVSS